MLRTVEVFKDSEDYVGEIFCSDSYEEAYDRAVDPLGTPYFELDDRYYSAGHYFNETQHPRTRGHVAILKINDSQGRRWIIEQVVARVTPAGPRRT